MTVIFIFEVKIWGKKFDLQKIRILKSSIRAKLKCYSFPKQRCNTVKYCIRKQALVYESTKKAEQSEKRMKEWNKSTRNADCRVQLETIGATGRTIMVSLVAKPICRPDVTLVLLGLMQTNF
jgi:hypothetical protein